MADRSYSEHVCTQNNDKTRSLLTPMPDFAGDCICWFSLLFIGQLQSYGHSRPSLST
jgi:hypothetical protein